jgi:hypothetical protein
MHPRASHDGSEVISAHPRHAEIHPLDCGYKDTLTLTSLVLWLETWELDPDSDIPSPPVPFPSHDRPNPGWSTSGNSGMMWTLRTLFPPTTSTSHLAIPPRSGALQNA